MSTVISGFSGRLIDRKHPAYDEVRRVHNGLIDKRPALIARCLGAVDVVDALAHARMNGLPVAIRGGGHNVAGRGLVDDGVVIDLSLMKGVHVDRRARTALAQGGATWGGFNRETQARGLATTGGVVSTTGVAGLTLGGGIGYLMGRYGLSIDNLESVEIVTADGGILTASATDEPDLFWALRGGGGNFGVVTSFLFRLHPVGPVVTGGIIAYPLDKAVDVFRFYREVNASAPEDLTIFGGLVHAPDGSKLVALVCGHCGARADGETVMAPIKRFGSPVMDTIGPMTYEALNMLFDAPNPPGALNYWKSSYLDDLGDEAIRAMADRFARAPSAMSAVLLEFTHGKAASLDPAATAFPHRRRGYNVVVISQWRDPSANAPNTAWARETYAALEPFTTGGSYVNYLADEGPSAAGAAYGSNYARLQQVKARYDPENVFRVNQNITPAR